MTRAGPHWWLWWIQPASETAGLRPRRAPISMRYSHRPRNRGHPSEEFAACSSGWRPDKSSAGVCPVRPRFRKPEEIAGASRLMIWQRKIFGLTKEILRPSGGLALRGYFPPCEISPNQSDAASFMILTIVSSTSCATPSSCGVLNSASRVVGFNVARMVLPPSS